MDLNLHGKTAFLSGSTSGIGWATARVLADEGVHVILNGRTQASVTKAIQRIQQRNPNAQLSGFAADFSNNNSITALIEQLPMVDILINNVGIYTAQSFFDTTDKDWAQHMEVNVMSGVRLSRHFLPKMLASNWGRILFISSECATLVPADLIAYSTTKAALQALSRGLAQLTAGTKVTVNAIVPGSTLTEGAEQFLADSAQKENKTKAEVTADFFKNVRTSSLLQRFISVDEIAHAIAYYASPLALATNGAAIKLDGGTTGGIV